MTSSGLAFNSITVAGPCLNEPRRISEPHRASLGMSGSGKDPKALIVGIVGGEPRCQGSLNSGGMAPEVR